MDEAAAAGRFITPTGQRCWPVIAPLPPMLPLASVGQRAPEALTARMGATAPMAAAARRALAGRFITWDPRHSMCASFRLTAPQAATGATAGTAATAVATSRSEGM